MWSRAKANRILPRECTIHSKHPFSTTQEMTLHMTSPNGQYHSQIGYILCSWRWRSSIQSAKTRPGTDCGLDNQLLIAKFRLKLKEVGKTTRPVRYDLNQIPYDYTVEVKNLPDLTPWLYLVNRVPEELWSEVRDIVGGIDQNHLKGSEVQEGKVIVWGGFTNSWGKKRSKRQGWKGKVHPTECRVPENSRERQ